MALVRPVISQLALGTDSNYSSRNCELAFSIAQEHLGIPALLEPGDVVDFEQPDQLSILTYTSQFYHKFAKVPLSPSKATTEVRYLLFSVRELCQEGQVSQ